MKYIILVMMVLCAITVSAGYEEHIDKIKQAEGQELESAVGLLFGDERINIVFTSNQGERIEAGVVTEDNIVKEISFEYVDNPTLKVYTTEAAIEKIAKADNTLDAFNQALKNDEITYEAIGTMKKVKFGFTRMAATVVGWFS